MAKILLFLLVLVAVFLLGRDMVVNRLNLILSDHLVRNIPFVIFLVIVSVDIILSPSGIALPRISAYLLMLDGLMLMMPSSYEKQLPAFLYPSVLAVCFLIFTVTEHLAPAVGIADAVPVLAVPITLTAFYYSRFRGRFSPEYSFFSDCSHVLVALSAVEVLAVSYPLEDGSFLLAALSLISIMMYAYIYLRRSKGRRMSSSSIKRPVRVAGEDAESSGASVQLDIKDEQYRMEVLFARVEKYMKEKEPFLDEHLTLADLASALYTNKASISKAINSLSGRNYCQYVNKYRVDYAVSLMMKDKRLKVIEIAMMSGFHSLASFNMAFRLFRSDTPSEFMRTVHLKDLS